MVLIGINAVVLTRLSDTSQKLVEQQSTTIKTKAELRSTSKDLESVKKEHNSTKSSLREERLKIDNLNKENQSLKANLQAKKEAEASLASQTQQVQVTAQAATVSGNKQTWLAQSGIPSSVWNYVDYLVTKESGWNPNAVNAGSGACGLGQQLPCGKWSGAWNDPVAALKAMHGYVLGRYGSWPNAVSHSKSVGWY